ncbi:hypothetical protein CEXT_217821 [Caerostris extrusa]|uniref:Transmembrane protein n=1 Tax=Caerostris extrusa TaxID=172846 RepID=A0AAV4P3C7_CAEEX|nr:hypothetical protein CEXT_217821 [Caerostris extrusa]
MNFCKSFKFERSSEKKHSQDREVSPPLWLVVAIRSCLRIWFGLSLYDHGRGFGLVCRYKIMVEDLVWFVAIRSWSRFGLVCRRYTIMVEDLVWFVAIRSWLRIWFGLSLYDHGGGFGLVCRYKIMVEIWFGLSL